MKDPQPRRIVVGRIAGTYGVRGWVKVQSFTEPVVQLLAFPTWWLRLESGWREFVPAEGRAHGKGIVAHLAGCDDRDAAGALHGAEIAVLREQFPPLPPGEYYRVDLEGLAVVGRSGVALGRVERLLDTGANAVMAVRGDRERLIPFIRGDVVLDVDLTGGVIRVDWDPEF